MFLALLPLEPSTALTVIEQPEPSAATSSSASTMATFHSPPQRMQVYRGPSLFQPHQARKALRDAHDGKIPPLVGVYLGLSTVATARFLAPFGFDVAWVDWEHSSCNVETMTTMVHELIFMSEGRTIPFVRVPGTDHAAIGFALDAGASIVVPQVETVEQAKHIVSAAKFGAKRGGSRSAPPFRLIPGVTDNKVDPTLTHHQNMNEQAAIMIQIETLEGINNLDAILTEVPEIDAVWLGTLDARVSMDLDGNYGMGGPEQEWQDAVAMYEAAFKKHPHVARAGFALGPDEVVRVASRNKDFVIVCADVVTLATMAEQMEKVKGFIQDAKAEEGTKVVVTGVSNGVPHGVSNGIAEKA